MPDGDDVGVTDLEDARRVIRDSQTSADRLIRASRELEHIVYGVSAGDTSLSATEYDIIDARSSLEQHKLFRARRSVRRAEKALSTLEEDVVEVQRTNDLVNTQRVSTALEHKSLHLQQIDFINANFQELIFDGSHPHSFYKRFSYQVPLVILL